jgi:hypothetical protein
MSRAPLRRRRSTRHPLDLPRLALLQTWNDTQSAGWVRMIFDQEKVPYTLIMDDDVRRGGLARVSTSSSTRTPTTAEVDRPRHGRQVQSAALRRDSRAADARFADLLAGHHRRSHLARHREIEDFVREGGLLVTLGGASTLPLRRRHGSRCAAGLDR